MNNLRFTGITVRQDLYAQLPANQNGVQRGRVMAENAQRYELYLSGLEERTGTQIEVTLEPANADSESAFGVRGDVFRYSIKTPNKPDHDNLIMSSDPDERPAITFGLPYTPFGRLLSRIPGSAIAYNLVESGIQSGIYKAKQLLGATRLQQELKEPELLILRGFQTVENIVL